MLFFGARKTLELVPNCPAEVKSLLSLLLKCLNTVLVAAVVLLCRGAADWCRGLRFFEELIREEELLELLRCCFSWITLGIELLRKPSDNSVWLATSVLYPRVKLKPPVMFKFLYTFLLSNFFTCLLNEY